MSVADRLNKLSTDITNAYTSIENKGGTIPANKNTENMSTAINSIEVIEQATAEGESLSLTNTKAMPYSDYVVEGKSEQETRSGKNLLNVTATTRTMNGVTITVNQDKSITLNGTNTSSETIFYRLADNFNLPAGTYTLSNHNNNVSNNNFIFYDDNYNFEERYNVVTKTFNTQKTIKPYLKVAAGITLNNEIIYPMIEKNSFMTDYEPYGASPSPDYPSEIHSVADDVNLFDVITATANQNNYVLNNDGAISNNKTWGNDGRTFFNNILLNAGNYIISYVPKLSGTTKNIRFSIKNIDSSTDIINQSISINNETRQSYSFSLSSNTNIAICIMPNGVNDGTLILNNIKLQKGSVATPYSPYNQGTVTIKQRGKNLWTSNLPIIFSDGSSIVQDNNNGGIDMTIASSASLGYIFYDLGLISDFAGKTLTFSISNEPNSLYRYCAFIACNADGSNRQELKNFYKNNQITYTVGNNYSQTHLAVRLYIAEATGGQTYSINNVQVEESSQKTSYEPYQGNDYTIQTEPLRSLPNGVKDTIEADGIHRRVGRVVLDGSENGWYQQDNTSYSEDYLRFTIGITDKKNASNPNSKKDNILSNNFTNKILDNNSTRKTNSITGQFSTNLINIFVAQNIINGSRVDDFKTWLSTHNLEVIYELNEEIIEPLTQNQATTMLDIIKTGSYEGTTNIYTDEDVKPTIGVGYYKKK